MRQADPVPDLGARLAAMLEQRPPAYRALLAEIADHLKTTAVSQSLRPGDEMPDFVLPNASGRLVSSAALVAQGPLVVVFTRGGWCPFCATTLAALNDVVDDLAALGVRLVALSPDAAGHSQATAEGLGLRFELLSDIDCAVGLRFGVVYRIPKAYQDILLSFDIDLAARHGEGPGLLPMPATFIAGCDGVLRFAEVSGDITERVEPARLAKLVEERQALLF